MASRTSPGSAARLGSISPDPASNGVAGVFASSCSTSGSAVVISDDFSAAGLKVGCSCVSSAAAPATCGADIDVPLIDWNSSPGRRFRGRRNGEAPARMFTPGAVTSGLAMSGTPVCGPRDEKAARMPPRGSATALPDVSDAVAPCAARALTLSPSSNEMCTDGTQCVSVTSSWLGAAL